MTEVAARPAPPRRSGGLIVPLVVVVVGFAAGGLTGNLAGGALWGIVGGAALVVGIELAGVSLSVIERYALVAASVASTILFRLVMHDVPERVTPSLVAQLGATMLVVGGVTGVVVARRHHPTTGVNVLLAWVGAGMLAAPAAVTFEVLRPLDHLGRAENPVFGVTVYVLAGTLVALVGGSAAIAGITRVRSVAVVPAILVITWFAGAQVGFTIRGLVENVGNIVNVPNFWPPDFGWAVGGGTWWWLPSWDFGAPTQPSPLLDTFRIAIVSSLIGCVVAIPVAFLASKVTSPKRGVYLLDRGFMNLIRTVPDLFWAMIFVAGVGIGSFAGVLALIFFSLAIMSKLLSETIDSVDTGPLEAAHATGSSHFPAVRVSVLPQVLPNYVAYALYVFEINIRASVVLGLVGAGGIGRVLEAQRSFFRFDRVLAVVAIIFVLVFVIEQVSVTLRRRLV